MCVARFKSNVRSLWLAAPCCLEAWYDTFTLLTSYVASVLSGEKAQA